MTRRPRLLRVITRLNVGGPATHVVVADRGLAERGWETLLVHGQIDEGEAEIELAALRDLPRHRIPTLVRPIRPRYDAAAFATLLGLIRRYRPDVVHTHLSKAGLLGRTAAMAGSPAARVHTFHGTVFGGYFGDRASGAIVRAERFLGNRTDRVIALSERQRVELLEHRIAPAERIRIVALGLPLDRLGGDRNDARRRLGLPVTEPIVVSIGRMVPIKRLDRLLRAFGGIVAKHPSAQLQLVGSGPERPALEGQVDAARLRDHVTFAGWSSAVGDWYAAADLVVLSSDREGTPLALIEAAAAGRPVVATDVGGVRDVVREGVTGFVVVRDDEAALGHRMSQLIGDPALRERLGAAGPEAARRFSADRLVADLDDLYGDLLSVRAKR